MKALVIAASLFICLAQTVLASSLTVKSYVTCEQDDDDGNKWYQVALVRSNAPSGYNIVVVLNDDEDYTMKRIEDTEVTLTQKNKGVRVYEDRFSIIKFEFNRKNLEGRLSLVADGPDKVKNKKMFCLMNSEITYPTSSGIEPRISVGN